MTAEALGGQFLFVFLTFQIKPIKAEQIFVSICIAFSAPMRAFFKARFGA